MIGFTVLAVALVLSLISAFFTISAYRREVKDGREYANTVGRACFCGAAACILAASAELLRLLLTDQFQYAYVWSYSSLDLPLFYKVSAFWAGQEGSFLLWLLIHAAAGFALLRKKQMPWSAFGVYVVLQVFLLAMLFAKSPFMVMEQPQSDGAGLNPLLQDPWMAIHPPVIFIGYALLAVPYSHAMGALLAGCRGAWIRRALPWTIAAWSFLGAGIFIGGYWAYQVLGWGGYWAWDPVENSSLVPWLLAGVLVHFLLMARRMAGAIRPSHAAALFTYVLVLYGAFLTRSGVLGDFSVHSFSDGGIGVYLAAFAAVAAICAFLALAVKWPEIPAGVLYAEVKSRGFAVSAGMAAMVFMAALVALGMSAPLLSAFFGKAQSVAPAFYNQTILPLAILLLLLLGAAFLVEAPRAKQRLIRAIAVFLAGFCAAYFTYGARAIDAAAAGAAFSAGYLAFGNRRMPGAVAHLGVAALTAGIIFSSAGSRSEIATFPVGEVKSALGRAITYQGAETKEEGRKRYYAFESQGEQIFAVTKLNQHGMDAAKSPGIDRRLAGDLYIAPSGAARQAPEYVLERKKTAMRDNLLFRLQEVGEESVPELKGRKLVKALLTVSDGERTDEVTLAIVEEADGFRALPAQALGNRYRLELTGVSGDGQKIRVRAGDVLAEQSREIQAEISWKPLIWMVWLGAGLIFGGCLAAVFKRRPD